MIETNVLQAKKTTALARWLLGKFLVRRLPDGRVDARMITETEAYDGECDLACHARAGRTARTAVMYAPGGVWYVYLCYGMHEMLNLVVGPRDWPAAVLIRGVEGVHGPGRVTKALGIDRRLNGQAVARASGLWLEDRGVCLPRGAVRATPRIGVDYAGPVWAKKRWRFVIEVGACLQAISMRPIACKQAPTKGPARPRPRSNSSPRRA
jgi:DNA-3-methyladenine glycosylase